MSKKTKTGQKAKMTELSNDPTEIISSDVVDEVIGDLTTPGKDDRSSKFALYWLLGLSTYRAAIRAGYSKNYASSRLYKKMKPGGHLRKEIERIVSKIPERYRQICQARLVTITEIEGKVLETFKEDPKLAIQRPALLKQIKQSSGVLADAPVQSPTVNIGRLQAISQYICANPEAEFETTPTSTPGFDTCRIKHEGKYVDVVEKQAKDRITDTKDTEET